MQIIKRKMPIGTAKDIENAIAENERLKAQLEYIAICDHPEMFKNKEEGINE